MNRTGLDILMGLILVFLCRSLFAADPVVSNVSVTQQAGKKLVDINYTVTDSDSASVTVSVAISTNGGATYNLPASSMTSGGSVKSIGAGVTPGSRRVVWDAGTDWNNKFSSVVKARVTADDGCFSSMVLIPAGTNTGTDPDFGSYSLTLPAALYMDKYEVTKAKWDDVYNWAVAHGYSFDNAGSGKAVNHPVQTVSWYDCVKWCNARSQMESRIPAYYTSSSKSLVYKTGQIDIEDNCVNWSSGYRLPTVGEYQYAARGGASGKRFPWGDTIDHSMANYYGFLYDGQNFDMGYSGHDRQYSVNGLPFTSPVGSYENGKNGYGLYDTAGNVTEWCWDLIHINVGTLGEILGSGILRADHGGCWDNPAYDCRIGECRGDSPDGTSTLIGLRTVLPFIQ